MRKLNVLEFVSLDGVIEASGGPEDDASGPPWWGTITAAFKVTESTVTSKGIIIVNYERAGAIPRGSL